MAQPGFTLQSLWQPAENGGKSIYRLKLTYRGSPPVDIYRLCVSGPARINSDAAITGAYLVTQLSNYAELAPEQVVTLTDGRSWEIVIRGMEFPLRHWTDGTTAAFVAGPSGVFPALTLPTQHSQFGNERRRGTIALPNDTGLELPLAILPWPAEVTAEGRQSVPAGLAVDAGHPAGAAFAEVTALLFPGEALVRPADEGGTPVSLRFEGGQPDEGYVLEWDGDGAQVTASTQTGLLYGLITLGQMQRGARTEPTRFMFPASGRISDAPAMGWRGCHLDVARRFYAADEIRRFLAILAWNKLNIFHWHLSDDEAFRVEIDAYPQLARTAAWRGFGLPIPPLLGSGPEPSGGVYSKDSVRELVRFAGTLGISVVPEVDVPGHCYALLQALPQLRDAGENGVYHSIQSFPNNCLNPAVEAVYPALETILGELIELFPAPWFHLGADEVPSDAWASSPAARALNQELGTEGAAPLQAHFLKRLQAFLRSRGKISGAWEEAAQGGGIETSDAYLVGWHTVEASQKLAANGYDVVVAPGQAYYLDMANSIDWREPGAGWAGWSSPETTYAFDPSAGWSVEERERLLGVQACIWSEPMSDRAVFDRLVFPRLSAIAETGWTPKSRKDFGRFSAIVGRMPNLYGLREGAV